MSEREIQIYRKFYMPDAVQDGEITEYTNQEEVTHDSEWIEDTRDYLGTSNDDDTEWYKASVVEAAVKLLNDEYVTEPSSYPEWSPGTWYSGSRTYDNYSGEMEDVSVHLRGFTEDEEREIYRRITKS
jgi:hypothetical protein